MWSRFKTLDPWLFVLPIILISISVVTIAALTVDTDGPSLYIHQLIYGIIGLILLGLATFVDYRSLKGWVWWLYGAGMLSLLAVRFIGTTTLGAQRWINLGFFQFQPGELEKLIIIVTVAYLLSTTATKVSLRRFFITVAALLAPVGLIILQPDLGTGVVSLLIGVCMLLHGRLTRLERWLIAAGLAVGLVIVVLSFHGVAPFDKILHDYQRNRLASFIDPKRDPGGSGYNVVQSVIAVGSGGMTGKGLGLGSQAQLNFLPIAYADFIFAVIAEAWGLVGAWGVIGLYLFLAVRCLQAARIAKDEFGMLLCIGVIIKIMVEVLVNIGMNIRLMPVTGIPLPFLSYGGTTLFTNALAIGLIQSVVVRYKRLTF